MSLSVNTILAWARIFTVPLTFCLTIIIVLWLVFRTVDGNDNRSFLPVPQLSIDLNKVKNTPTIKEQKQRESEISRNPFSPVKTVGPVYENIVDLHSVSLDLIIISSRKRLCWVNGKMMREGDGAERFTVEEIGERGVWFGADSGRFFLKTGESIEIDSGGSLRVDTEQDKTSLPLL